jgi:hypothetical protein
MWTAQLKICSRVDHRLREHIQSGALPGVTKSQRNALVSHLNTSLKALVEAVQNSLNGFHGKCYSDDTWQASYQPRDLNLVAWNIRLKLGAEEAIAAVFKGARSGPVKIIHKASYDVPKTGYERYTFVYGIRDSDATSKKDDLSITSKLVWKFTQGDANEIVLDSAVQTHYSNQSTSSSTRLGRSGIGLEPASSEGVLTAEGVSEFNNSENTDRPIDGFSATTFKGS